MAIAEELRGFVKESLERGISRPDIEGALQSAGWPSDQVRGALRGFAELDFALPVPVPKPYLSAREAFLYLVLFTMLYFSAFNLGAVVFHLIDMAFPDPATTAQALEIAREEMRWSISLLVVASPVFLFVSALTGREIRRDPSKRASKVRRWLTYLTLFVAVSVLFGDVAALVHSVLSGGLTVRFLLKVATVAGVAGTVFWYYLRDLGLDEEEAEA